MITYFIFKSTKIFSADIDSYLSQLTNLLIKSYNVKIYLVNYHVKQFKEFTIETLDNSIINVNVPLPLTKITNERMKQKYASKLVDLLTETFNSENNIICQVLSPTDLPLVKQLKSRFRFRIVCVINSIEWEFLSNINKLKFEYFQKKQFDFDYQTLKGISEENEIYDLSDKIITTTNFMKEFIIKNFNIKKEKVSVIINGIHSSDYKILDNEKKNDLKKQLGFPPNEKIILFSGRLSENEELLFILDAFSELNLQYENLRLIVIGEDLEPLVLNKYLTYCENIWGKVTFTGFLELEKVLKIYHIADIGIFPSVFDHCSFSFLRMIDHNIPMIISNTGGLNEILTDYQSVYLTPVYDGKGNISFNKKEVIDAIKSLVNDEGKAKNLTKAYHELIINKFSSEIMAEEMHTVLNNLCTTTFDERS